MSSSDASTNERPPSFFSALVAGGMAGTCVDVALFPIDTIKTRLQAPQGFLKAGGFAGVYQGLGAAAVGSAPGAALFFSVYETMKPKVLTLQKSVGVENESLSHMVAASIGEAAACLVRVPTEVVKGRMQTGASVGLMDTLHMVLKEKHHGPLAHLTGGLYRGYGITLMREIPFAVIQFPLYERAKLWVGEYQNGVPASPVQAAACGSVSGGIAAGATTPLDVVKTRLMLGADRAGVPYKSGVDVLQRVMAEEGAATLLSGIQPRVMWISIGGFVFFGAYEGFRSVLTPVLG